MGPAGLCAGAVSGRSAGARGGPGRVSRFPPAACPFPVSFAALRRPVLPVPAPGGSGRAAPWGRSGLPAPRTVAEPPLRSGPGSSRAVPVPCRAGASAARSRRGAAVAPQRPRAALPSGSSAADTAVAPPFGGLLCAPAPAGGGALVTAPCAAHTSCPPLPGWRLTGEGPRLLGSCSGGPSDPSLFPQVYIPP